MATGLEVERLSEDGLTREIWRFRLAVHYTGAVCEITLNYYARQSRDTTRHKFRSKPSEQWDSFDQRYYHSGIKANAVPLPDDIKEQAKAQVILAVIGATR